MKKDKFYDIAKQVAAKRNAWRAHAEGSTIFQDLGGKYYPYDTIDANIDHIWQLLEQSELIEPFFEKGSKVIDIGAANGELSFLLKYAGIDVTALDYSFGHDQSTTLISLTQDYESLPFPIIDMSVDQYFDRIDLKKSALRGPVHSDFDFALCLGVLYHLKNPFAFLESLSQISNYLIIGTHIITHLSGIRTYVGDASLAYLVDEYELNHDPTNYWMLTRNAFDRLLNRTNWESVASFEAANNDLMLAVPDDPSVGIRRFHVARSLARQ